MLLLPFSPAFLNPAVYWNWKGIYYKIKILENPIHMQVAFMDFFPVN